MWTREGVHSLTLHSCQSHFPSSIGRSMGPFLLDSIHHWPTVFIFIFIMPSEQSLFKSLKQSIYTCSCSLLQIWEIAVQNLGRLHFSFTCTTKLQVNLRNGPGNLLEQLASQTVHFFSPFFSLVFATNVKLSRLNVVLLCIRTYLWKNPCHITI